MAIRTRDRDSRRQPRVSVTPPGAGCVLEGPARPRPAGLGGGRDPRCRRRSGWHTGRRLRQGGRDPERFLARRFAPQHSRHRTDLRGSHPGRWADAEVFSPKAAAAFFGLNPSRWESGLTVWPSRPITKGLSVEDELTKLTQLRAAVCSLRPVRGSEAETAWRLNALGSPRRNGGFKSQSYGDSASISAARTAVRT